MSYNGVNVSTGTATLASTVMSRDANSNSRVNNLTTAATAVTSAAGTTVLLASSGRTQVLQGSSNQTFQLPDATTLVIGWTYEFNNNSTGVLTVVNASSTTICTIPAGGYARVFTISVSTSAGAWDAHFLIPLNGSYGTAGLSVTGTVTSSALTQYQTLVAGASGLISGVTPSSTSGVPLISQGSSATPAYGTAVVAGGGTGIATTTAYAPICGGTAATGAFQAATTGFSTSGTVLVSNGSSALPSWNVLGSTTWSKTSSTSISLAAGSGFITTSDSAITATLPTSSATIGTAIEICGLGNGVITIAQGTGQKVVFGNQVTTVGATGSLASTSSGDSLKLICTTAASGATGFWVVVSAIGNWTVT